MKTIILDRDGVLNEKPDEGQYVLNKSQFRWLPKSRAALQLLKENGFRIIVATNQSAIGRGLMTERDLYEIHEQMKRDLASEGIQLDAVYHCPHRPEEGCPCRKPKPGLLLRAQRDFDLDLSKTFFVGDDPRDEQAGRAVGCLPLLISQKTTLLDLVKKKVLPFYT